MSKTLSSPFDTHDLDVFVGREAHMGDLGRALVRVVASVRPAHVASLHVTCSDGLERLCAKTFHDTVARDITVPADREWAPLRTSNLGGRYEWGSGGVGFSHFVGAPSNMMVAQINSHVGVIREARSLRFGTHERSGRMSPVCGALFMVLAGRTGPFATEMREALSSEGLDRMALLNDPDSVSADYKYLYGAIVNARLQARRALLDLARPLEADEVGADLLLVLAAVTFNQRGADHELLVGYYAGKRDADGVMQAIWCGLGDNPTKYQYEFDLAGVKVTQPGPLKRKARGPKGHRELPLEKLADHLEDLRAESVAHQEAGPEPLTECDRPPVHLDPHSRSVLDQVDALLNDPDHPWSSLAVKGACIALTEVLAVPAVLTLFAGGALAANHAFRMQRIARGGGHEHEVEELAHETAIDLQQRDPREARSILKSATARLRQLYAH